MYGGVYGKSIEIRDNRRGKVFDRRPRALIMAFHDDLWRLADAKVIGFKPAALWCHFYGLKPVQWRNTT